MASESATSSALLAPPPSTTADFRPAAPLPLTPATSSSSDSAFAADAAEPPSPPSLSDVQQQSALLSAQLRALVLSVHARSRQYAELTSSYLSLLSTSVEAAVSDAELCCERAHQLVEAAEGMNAELQHMDEVERVVKHTLRQVLDLERRVVKMQQGIT